ncbi:hypothetical protein E2562_021561, partial [Oryza meyeriana var. granulata]
KSQDLEARGCCLCKKYNACAFMAWCQNVELMPNTLKDDVLEDNRIKPSTVDHL